MPIIALNFGKKLRPIHLLNRRKRASRIVKQEIAKKFKIPQENVAIGSKLNKILSMKLVQHPRKMKLNVDISENKAKVDVYEERKASAQQQAPAQQASQPQVKQQQPKPVQKQDTSSRTEANKEQGKNRQGKESAQGKASSQAQSQAGVVQ